MSYRISEDAEAGVKDHQCRRAVGNPLHRSGTIGFVLSCLNDETKAKGQDDESDRRFDEPGFAVVCCGFHEQKLLR